MPAKRTHQNQSYDDRVKATIKGLSAGKSRNDLAKKFGLSSWKSLDIYMRRKGFTWDSEMSNYVPSTVKGDKKDMEMPSSIPVKAQEVIELFSRYGDEADPRAIAKKLGFSNHREVAEYMEAKGFTWDSDKGNYVLPEKLTKKASVPSEHNLQTVAPAKKQILETVPIGKELSPGSKPGSKLEVLCSYLPLLELLTEYQDRLLDLLIAKSESNIPKYTVPGVPKTKSIYMSDLLSQLVSEFSEMKHLSQREIVESALIEYLERYGYQSQIDKLLAK